MKLKNMEQKQLNFNQPILSVRRGSSITAPPENKRKDNVSHSSLPPLPYYKSELKSGPVRNPGVVPFKWEQMPGRPKDENKSRKVTLKWLPPTPKLPPGRVATHTQNQKDEVLKDPPPVSKTQAEISVPHSLGASSPDKTQSNVQGSEMEKEENYNSSSEDENVTYVDARDTLSRTESFFNCSVSGVSGLDGPESSGTFSDPQTRDFMMGRFLPAAKAVASEVPPFASRKHTVPREQERPITKVVTLKKQFPEHYSTLDTFLHKNNDEDKDVEVDTEDESDAEDESVKFCGLLPRFCMLSPLPGMRDHVEALSSVQSVRTRSKYAGAFRDDESKVGTKNERGGMKRTSHQYDSVPTNESLVNAHLIRRGMLREKNASPQRFLDKEKQFLGLPGEPRDLSGYRVNSPKNDYTELEFAAPPKTDRIACLVNPAEERTLYVDSERMVESRHSNSSSSESRGRNPSVDYSLQDICANEKAMTHSKSSDTTYSSAVSTSEKSCQEIGEDMKCLEKVEQNVNLMVVKQPSKSDKSTKHAKNCSSPLVLSPLLPKSPSESWLSRTLPSMSSRNPSSKSYLANHAFRASPVEPKRERLLKASNVHNMMFQSAGELTPILEN